MNRRFSASDVLGFRSVFVILRLAGFALLPALLPGVAAAIELTSERLEELRREAAPAIVKIEGSDRQGDLVGTGFFIDATGTIATSYSVGGEADNLFVTAGALRLPARRLVADRRSGLAFLKIEAETPALPLRDDVAGEGTEVAAFGYPMGGGLEGSSGRVVARQIRNGDRFFATTHLRALVAAQPGMGGAPVLDADGRVAGIVISKTETSLGCFALPGRALLKVQADRLRFGEVRHGWLGIELSEIDLTEQNPEARVAALAAGGPSEKSGILPGDLIRRIGSAPVNSAYDLLDATFFLAAGDTVRVGVEREGKLLEFEVVAADHPGLGRAGSGRPASERGMMPVSAPQ